MLSLFMHKPSLLILKPLSFILIYLLLPAVFAAEQADLDFINAPGNIPNRKPLDLSNADLRGYQFSPNSINLQRALLTNANLTNINLTGMNLSGANLTGADLSGVNLTAANLANATLSHTILKNANLTAANLQGALIIDTNLQQADLTRANLSCASFTNTDLKGADFSYALISGATFKNTSTNVSVNFDTTMNDTNILCQAIIIQKATPSAFPH